MYAHLQEQDSIHQIHEENTYNYPLTLGVLLQNHGNHVPRILVKRTYYHKRGFPDSSDGKEYTCKAGDLSCGSPQIA